jgi:hypothetical protein
LAAAADAGCTAIIVTSGPSATPGAAASKPSGGLFAFAPKIGGSSKGRAAAAAEKAGLESYVVVTAAGLNAAGEEATSQNLVLAEAGTVDPATAGATHNSAACRFYQFRVVFTVLELGLLCCLESYVVTAAGLNAAGEEATSQNLVLAEAGTVDPATAGATRILVFSCVFDGVLDAGSQVVVLHRALCGSNCSAVIDSTGRSSSSRAAVPGRQQLQ